jgi:hypothetical protein
MPIPKRSLVLLPFFAVLMASCTYHTIETRLSNTCSVGDPVNDLRWLREMIESAAQWREHNWYIQQGTYQGETVFAFNLCCETCNYTVPVYNCSGQRIFDSLYEQGSSSPRVKDLVTIAKPDNFQCLQ